MSLDQDRRITTTTLPVIHLDTNEIVGEVEVRVYTDTGYGAVVVNNVTENPHGPQSGARFFPGINPERARHIVKEAIVDALSEMED